MSIPLYTWFIVSLKSLVPWEEAVDIASATGKGRASSKTNERAIPSFHEI